MTLFDQFFMLPESYAKSNCLGVQFVEKFQYDEMREYFLDKLEQSPFFRIKAKVVEKFGQFWFEKISDAEWKNYRENLVT